MSIYLNISKVGRMKIFLFSFKMALKTAGSVGLAETQLFFFFGLIFSQSDIGLPEDKTTRQTKATAIPFMVSSIYPFF